MGFWERVGLRKPKQQAGRITQLQNLSREYPEDTITPRNLKQILKDADIGLTARYMELLDACAVDFKVASVLRTRKLAVAGAPFCFEAGDESETAQTIADETLDWFQHIPNVRQFMLNQLDAHYRGFAVTRLEWEVVKGRQMVVAHEPIESRFFRFQDAAVPLVMTEANPNGEPMPAEWLFHSVQDKPGPVTRGGTGRSIVKLWLYKGYNLVDLASYLEKFGMPHVQVKLPANYVEGSPELERAKDAARSLIADNIGLVPANVTIELLESIKQTSTVNDTHLAFQRWCEEGIATAELGGTLTSGESRVGGIGHGQEAKQHAEVRQDIKEADATALMDHLHHRLIWPRTIRQYGEGAPLPKLVLDVEEPENAVEVATAQKLRAEAIQILKTAGLEVSIRQIRDEFDLQEPDGDDDVLVGEEPEPDGAAPKPNSQGRTP